MPLRTSNKKAVDLIRDRIVFTGSNFHGVIPSPDPNQIVMGEYAGTLFVEDIKYAEYIVYSYSTPIAWFYGGGWNVTTDRFSATTSRHQSIVRRAIQ
jgi:hypothetical protein